MNTASTQSLRCHPASTSTAVRGLEVRVRRLGDGALSLCYVLDADLERLRIPPVGPSVRTAGLWTHTCFEAFIAGSGISGYYELNFAPSTQWAIYGFRAYREGMSPAPELPPPAISVGHGEQRLSLEAGLRLADGGALRLALAAVIEDDNGRLSYWALNHPAERPDFHHPDSFALEFHT